MHRIVYFVKNMKAKYKNQIVEIINSVPDEEGKIVIVDAWDNYWNVEPCELQYLDANN